MHPFSLNEEEIKQVSGGVLMTSLYVGEEGGGGTGVSNLLLENGGGVVTSNYVGEEGGVTPPIASTDAIGEEGGGAV